MAHRVLVVLGTRPEAIKMAPVVSALAAYAPEIETRVALTGQHTTLVDQALETFGIRPDYDLDIMQEGQTLYGVMYGALDGLKDVLRDYEPDLVLVQGDTATVFTGALVGFFERVAVGHVEAGLRSHDKWAPFPEEMFRRMADVLADYCFAPTQWAASELLTENIRPRPCLRDRQHGRRRVAYDRGAGAPHPRRAPARSRGRSVGATRAPHRAPARVVRGAAPRGVRGGP